MGVKYVTSAFSNPGTIMTEIVWQRQSISCRFDLPRILGCRPTFSEIREFETFQLLFHLLIGWSPRWKLLVFFTEKSLLSSSLLWCVATSFFVFVRWRKQRERMEMMGMATELLPFGSLVSTKHQFSRWSYREISVFATRLCYQEGQTGLPIWFGFFVWSPIGSVQL